MENLLLLFALPFAYYHGHPLLFKARELYALRLFPTVQGKRSIDDSISVQMHKHRSSGQFSNLDQVTKVRRDMSFDGSIEATVCSATLNSGKPRTNSYKL